MRSSLGVLRSRAVRKDLMDLIVNMSSVLRPDWFNDFKCVVKPVSKRGIRNTLLIWDRCSGKR